MLKLVKLKMVSFKNKVKHHNEIQTQLKRAEEADLESSSRHLFRSKKESLERYEALQREFGSDYDERGRRLSHHATPQPGAASPTAIPKVNPKKVLT